MISMTRTLTLVFLGLLSALGIGGAVRSVYAIQSQRPATTTAQPSQSAVAQNSEEAEEEADEPDDDEMDDDQEEQQEEAQLQSLAKITPQQAEEAARAVTSGTVSRVSLDNEDGSVVYKVIIGQSEVLVDAGNGTVLETETSGDESSPEAAPAGSIQVPDDDDGSAQGMNP
ncbi:peptidase [filamentous cyanobacterium CCP5]|nr:peptidase [filamentous cyanobacterium CCP5]